MNDKDARDMHRLAVGAGEAPTDAQIDAVRQKYVDQGFPVNWYRDFARAVLALSPPAIPEVVNSGAESPVSSDDLRHLVYRLRRILDDFSADEYLTLHRDFMRQCLAALTTPPPAPSSPAPVAEIALEGLQRFRLSSKAGLTYKDDAGPFVRFSDVQLHVSAILANPAAPSPESGS